MQNPDFVLPSAFSEIVVYNLPAVKSIVPTLMKPTRERQPERDLEIWLHYRSYWEMIFLQLTAALNPSLHNPLF